MTYDLILTDFQMPIMNGVEATFQIRNHLSQLDIDLEDQPKIVGITGHVQEKYKNEGTKAGMNEIYGKPFCVQDMMELFEKYNIDTKIEWEHKIFYN